MTMLDYLWVEEQEIVFQWVGLLAIEHNRLAEEGKEYNQDIYAAEPKGGGYAEPVRLGSGVNTGGYEADAFVAYDGSYLIFGAGNEEWIRPWRSFHQLSPGGRHLVHGTWSKAKNLGEEINTKGHELCPFVLTSDGQAFPGLTTHPFAEKIR